MELKNLVLEDIDVDTVKEILRQASLRELNIFHDKNQIIKLLCKALLKSWATQGRQDLILRD